MSLLFKHQQTIFHEVSKMKNDATNQLHSSTKSYYQKFQVY